MRVQVEVLCAPHHPAAAIEQALRSAGRRLTPIADSISVELREREDGRRIAILAFERPGREPYKAIDEIWEEVKFWTWQFREDLAVWFPRD